MTPQAALSTLGRRFEVGLSLRIGVLLLAGAALAWAIAQPGLYATTLLTGRATEAVLCGACVISNVGASVRLWKDRAMGSLGLLLCDCRQGFRTELEA